LRIKKLATSGVLVNIEERRNRKEELELFFNSLFLAIAILAGVVNFLPHPNPPLIKGRE